MFSGLGLVFISVYKWFVGLVLVFVVLIVQKVTQRAQRTTEVGEAGGGDWVVSCEGVVFVFYPQITQIYTDKGTSAGWHLWSSVESVDK